MSSIFAFKDHVGVIDELRAKYQRSDDDHKVLAVEQMQDDIARMAQTREQQVRQAIRGRYSLLCSEATALQCLLRSPAAGTTMWRDVGASACIPRLPSTPNSAHVVLAQA